MYDPCPDRAYVATTCSVLDVGIEVPGPSHNKWTSILDSHGHAMLSAHAHLSPKGDGLVGHSVCVMPGACYASRVVIPRRDCLLHGMLLRPLLSYSYIALVGVTTPMMLGVCDGRTTYYVCCNENCD